MSKLRRVLTHNSLRTDRALTVRVLAALMSAVSLLPLRAAIAANPFLSFTTIATESGRIDFTWTGDNGFSANETAQITVE